MTIIQFNHGEHRIEYVITEEQTQLIKDYEAPLKRKLAEEQAAKYRKDSQKYRSLGYVANLLDDGVYEPYLGAIGGGSRYILHKIDEQEYAVQYQYLDAKPIWLTEKLGLKAKCIYRVTPTSLGYIVHYEIDITDYENW